MGTPIESPPGGWGYAKPIVDQGQVRCQYCTTLIQWQGNYAEAVMAHIEHCAPAITAWLVAKHLWLHEQLGAELKRLHP